MSSKRGPTSDLNHDNWDNEEEPEERGTFREATDDELQKRVIRKARRRMANTAYSESGDASGTSSAATRTLFSGFQGFSKVSATSGGSSPFSFLSKISTTNPAVKESEAPNAKINLIQSTFDTTSTITTTSISNTNGKTATPASSTATSFATQPKFSFGNSQNTFLTPTTSPKTQISNKASPKNEVIATSITNDANKSYLAKVAKLNIDISIWIKMVVDKNPYCLLTPILRDYENYLDEIKREENIIDDRNGSKFNKFNSNAETAATTTTTTTTTPILKSFTPPVAATSNNENAAVIKNIFGGFSTKSVVDSTKTNGLNFGIKSDEKSATLTSMSTAKAPTFNFNFKNDQKTENEKKAEQPKATQFTFGKKTDTIPFKAVEKVHDDEKPSTSSASFVVKANEKPQTTGFSFGSTSTLTTDKPTINFGFGSKNTSNVDKPTTSFSFGNTMTTDDKPSTSANANKFSFGTKANDKPAFSLFGSTTSKPFQFNNVAPNTTKPTESAQNEEAEDDEPPKVEFTQVIEEDAIYSKKCKVFIKKGDAYTDRGVGTLYLKPIKETKKTQLLVRADTNLGNVLINFILNNGIPSKRMGKNNVMLVCLPTPDFEKPTPILLRVKTADEADELLEKIDAQKYEAE